MLHKNLTPADRHAPHSFEYANAAAREAATGFVTADINKQALQLDDGTYWRLTAITPTWVAVAAGGSGAWGDITDKPTFTGEVVGTAATIEQSIQALDVALTTAEYFPTALTVANNGAASYTGTVADLQVLGGTPVVLTEGGTFEFIIEWTGVTHFTAVHLHYRYYSVTTNSSHTVNLQIWNAVSSSWENMLAPVNNNSATMENVTWLTGDGAAYIDGTGKVLVQFDHGTGSSGNHRLEIDHVVLIDGPSLGSATVTTHAGLGGRSAADQHPMSAITGLETALAGKSDTNHTHAATGGSESFHPFLLIGA